MMLQDSFKNYPCFLVDSFEREYVFYFNRFEQSTK